MDKEPVTVSEESAEWEHPPPTSDVSGADDREQLDRPAVTSTDIDAEPSEVMPDPPRLPDALFEGELDDEQVVHWYLREDANVLMMTNDKFNREQYRAVTTTPLIRTSGGEFEWEIPVQLIDGHPEAADVPDTALIQPSRSIHFRASEAMIDGPTRTCYVMTSDRLEQLTG